MYEYSTVVLIYFLFVSALVSCVAYLLHYCVESTFRHMRVVRVDIESLANCTSHLRYFAQQVPQSEFYNLTNNNCKSKGL